MYWVLEVLGQRLHLSPQVIQRSQELALGPLPQLKAGFKAAEHRVIVSAGTGRGKIDEPVRRAGVERRTRLTVPHFVGLGHLLRRTHLLATVIERLAESRVEPFGLTLRPPPIELPDIAISVFWHAKVHRSPMHPWSRVRCAICLATARALHAPPTESASPRPSPTAAA